MHPPLFLKGSKYREKQGTTHWNFTRVSHTFKIPSLVGRDHRTKAMARSSVPRQGKNWGWGGGRWEAAVEAPTTHPRAPPPRSREARPGWPCTPTHSGARSTGASHPLLPEGKGKIDRGREPKATKRRSWAATRNSPARLVPRSPGMVYLPPEDTRSQGRDGHGATAGVLEDPASSGDRSGRVGGSTVGSRGGDDRDRRAARAA